MLSVNTNYGAMVALQNLNKTNQDMAGVQSAINTGLKVAGPKDNGAIFAIAQGMRADVMSYNAVTNSLNRAISAVDTAVAAGQAISDLLTEMKEKALAASDTSIDQNSREAYNADFEALRDQIGKVLENSEFDGINLLDGSTAEVRALANAEGSKYVSVAAQSMSLGGAILTVTATATISTQVNASAMIATLDASIDQVNLALSKLGTGSKKLTIHKTFVDKLSDELDRGIGNLVDADMATESARLQSLQTKQQLGVQALSIANQAPQAVLSLFRS
jgi:flagellin